MKCALGEGVSLDILKDDLSCVDIIEQKLSTIGREDSDDAFYIVDLADVLLKHKKWVSLLPRVEPFYAMKCNTDPVILKMLTGLGIGFDCASKTEMQTMLGMGVSPAKIVYANPCKQASHIRFSAKHGISLMTFDNEMELHKIKELYPSARLLLRIRTDDSKSLCQLGIKYGAPLKQCRHLLKVAHDLKLNVIGVSFHVGSGCYDASAFGTAVSAARSVFDLGAQIGYNFTMLDIGGGFPGAPDAAITFEEVCAILNPLLEEHFPVSSGVRIIAEPGRYYSASAFTLVVNVVARRTVKGSQLKQNDKSAEAAGCKDSDELGYMYYVNDGVYGSFNCLVFDHATVNPEVCGTDKKAEKFPSSIWGPTCDSLDCITKNVLLPKVDVGEWLYFRNMGAYTCSAASTFNGFNKPLKYYTIAHSCWPMLKKVLEKIGLDVHLPCHVSLDHKTSFNTSPECMEILTSAP
ncbi:ornithine decarboxylase-like [Oculina patagonica]